MQVHRFHLQPDGPDEVEDLLHDGIGHLGFVDDVPQQGLGFRRLGQFAPEEAGEHLDAHQRVLDFVRDGRRHFADRGQPIPEAFAFLDLFDARQVREEHRRADRVPRVGVDVRERVADDLARSLQPQFGAVGEQCRVRRGIECLHDLGIVQEHIPERPSDVSGVRLDVEDPLRLVVDERDALVRRDRQHAVPHRGDDAPEEGVVARTGVLAIANRPRLAGSPRF